VLHVKIVTRSDSKWREGGGMIHGGRGDFGGQIQVSSHDWMETETGRVALGPEMEVTADYRLSAVTGGHVCRGAWA